MRRDVRRAWARRCRSALAPPMINIAGHNIKSPKASDMYTSKLNSRKKSKELCRALLGIHPVSSLEKKTEIIYALL